MADENNKAEGTPLVPDDLTDDWSDVDMLIPTRAQLEEREKEKSTDDAKKVDGTDTTDNEDDEVDDTAIADDTVEYVPDPGEYQPADYSFEITTYEGDDKTPKSHKITSVDDWEKLMEAEPNFGSAVALDKAMRMARKMEANQEQDYKEWKSKKDDYEKVSKADQARDDRIKELDNEMSYLVSNGDMPKLTKEQIEADWNNKSVQQQDGIKEHLELLKYAEKLAVKRAKSGLSGKISLIDAFNERERQNAKSQSKQDHETEVADRKAAGAKVQGGGSAATVQAPKGIAVGKGGSLDDLGNNWW